MEILKRNKGITLIALVITIIILLILAGVAISSLGGENGLFANVKRAKQAQIKAEMREQLVLALQELQLEKKGDATLDDVTQEWADSILEDYEPIVSSDASISGKKVTMSKGGVTGRYIIDEKLNIVETEETTGTQLTYEVKSRDGENLQIVVTVTDNENGLEKIEFNDGHIVEANGRKTVSRDCIIQLGVEYKVKITSKSGEEKTETILINDYYHTITKNLGEGISIDNTAIKAAYNKSYTATLTTGEEYILDTFTVTMGGEPVTVDASTGVINIEKVTGDIVITATAKKLEIQVSNIIIGTENPPTSSVNDNSQTRGDKLYINFSATIEGTVCIVTPTIPYEITTNGKYKFTATGIYNGITITKDIEIQVNKYKSATGLVQYDAGDWTQTEIDILNNNKLYDFNESRTTNIIFKLDDDSGLNLTFGGFKAGTSRNNSVSPGDGYGIPRYDGWQVLESYQQNGKTYVTKLIHAGTPENFIYGNVNGDEDRAEYLLSNGERKTTDNKLENSGTIINPRNWDMYKDKELDKKGYIKEVHAMTSDEASSASLEIRTTKSCYFLASTSDGSNLWGIGGEGNKCRVGGGLVQCWGIRPVVEMNEGVYITSGTGTEADPFILAKEPTE